jgi:thiamine biosynthesis protein ThiS
MGSITVNGETEAVTFPLTVADLLKTKNLDASCVVVEVNMNILTKESFAQTQLQDADTVEILRFVGGG